MEAARMSRSDRNPPRLSRRSFIKSAGLAAGALAAGPLIAPETSAEAAAAPLAVSHTIGVLLATSQTAPNLGRNFLAGMQLAFKALGVTKSKLVPQTFGTSSS